MNQNMTGERYTINCFQATVTFTAVLAVHGNKESLKDLKIGIRMKSEPGSQEFITLSLNARANLATKKRVAS